MTVLFRSTLFLSALLLFSVQPLMGKMLLPVFGGAPSVWQTALVFFQALLLAGYAYAHWLSRKVTPLKGLALHAGLMALAVCFLPLALGSLVITPEMTSSHQALHLLGALLRLVGLPFFILSSTSPLLQRWYSTTGCKGSRDPYSLSVASNSGSFVALLAFPLLVEPSLTLGSASGLWTGLYLLLVPLVLSCAWLGQRAGGPVNAEPKIWARMRSQEPVPDLAWRRRLGWVAMAAVPSSLMLGLTSFITTEVASIPLLGILPLALYLATFIVAFAQQQRLSVTLLSRLLPFSALALMFQMFTEATDPIAIIVVLHLTFFFLAGLLCHRRLAEDRPEPESLTAFYLWMSVGGVLGGLFNALLAPVLFPGLAEYPIAIVAACLFRVGLKPSGAGKNWTCTRWDVAAPLGVLLLCLVLVFGVGGAGWLKPHPLKIAVFAAGALATFASIDRTLRFAASLAALLVTTLFMESLHGHSVEVERNFFGVSRVTIDPDGRSYRLVHGNTIHGRQRILPTRSCEPLTYFHRSGPLGRIFRVHDSAPGPGKGRIGVVGLGCGAIAGYARLGQEWDYYEIDPAVIRIATNPRLFTFIHGCSPVPIRIIEGDARLRLREAEEGRYDLLIMDAFSSDSIPLHLITREAIALYLSKLSPEGLFAIHISNRYLELSPVVAALAEEAGLAGYHWEDASEEQEAGKEPSHWAVLARKPALLEGFKRDPRWSPIEECRGQRPWTDDFSNVLSVFRPIGRDGGDSLDSMERAKKVESQSPAR